jgi:hypothetical protein
LHNITKKGVKGPPPWVKGSEYDIAFHKLKAIIANSKLYLHHKDALRRLFVEVDASDVGWGACAYQMLKTYIGDPGDEGRMRIGDTGPRQIIQWISKAWTSNIRANSTSVLSRIIGQNTNFGEVQKPD